MLDPQHDAAIGFISSIMPLHAPTSCSWRGTAPAPAAERRSARTASLIACSVLEVREKRKRLPRALSEVERTTARPSPVVWRHCYWAGNPTWLLRFREREQEVKETGGPREPEARRITAHRRGGRPSPLLSFFFLHHATIGLCSVLLRFTSVGTRYVPP